MQQPMIQGNPFALMMEPDLVIDAMQHSERLSNLKRHVYHPLDKPLISPRAGHAHTGATEFDQSIDAEATEFSSTTMFSNGSLDN